MAGRRNGPAILACREAPANCYRITSMLSDITRKSRMSDGAKWIGAILLFSLMVTLYLYYG
jgi:hypothetical protein